MYEFIEGVVAELTPADVVIQAGGIGYLIHISLNTYSQLLERQKQTPQSLQKIYLHHVVREDAQLLFGFFSLQERVIFRLLVTVSGVGANTARMILSSLGTSEIQKAIAEGNVTLLKGVKGIGLKTAQRIIIDLKDKIGMEGSANDNFFQLNNTIKDEALSALVTLGFSKSAIEKIVDKILASKSDMSVEELIKQTLKNV
jgi:Holliday junction DNA helicase RuvA